MASFLRSLEDLYKSGQLKDLEQDLDCFIRSHLSDLRTVIREGHHSGQEIARRRHRKGEISSREFTDYCVRSVLRRRGSCNPGRDIEEQRREIEKEVWYEGERARRPLPAERREDIARKWALHHASNWREWRLFQMLFIWDKKADQYLRLIAEEQ